LFVVKAERRQFMQVAVQQSVNGVDVEALMGTVRAVKEQPELGKSKFRVINRWVTGGLNRTNVQGFYTGGKEDVSREKPFVYNADEPPVLAGENRGANPVEYALTALASCLTTSMVYHAASRGIKIDEIEAKVEGDIDLGGFMGVNPNVPKAYQNIRVKYNVRSDAPAEKLRELALFSPVYHTITSPVPVSIEVAKK
jgi:uncharacterized OsmC-like protein